MTARLFAGEVASQMKAWTLPLPLPTPALWPLCVVAETVSWLTRKPGMLSRQKFAELRAPGWVCNPEQLRQELGFVCATTLKSGITTSLAWYRQQGWL